MRALAASAVAVVLFTLALGFGYPALMTGFAAVTFPTKATGSLVQRNGAIIGSTLAAQAFSGPRWFHERPSATTPPYDAAATTFSNLGPTNPALAKLVRANARAILRRERPYNSGLTIHDIPVDAVVPSGSGIDPQISPAYADLQARRIATVRHLPLSTVETLIARNTNGRTLGFFGEPGVNVLTLNLALAKER
jgi:K+-transporting ATPase ATPase C chain